MPSAKAIWPVSTVIIQSRVAPVLDKNDARMVGIPALEHGGIMEGFPRAGRGCDLASHHILTAIYGYVSSVYNELLCNNCLSYFAG